VRTDALSLAELFAPTLFVLGSVYVLGPLLPLARGWARILVFVFVWLVIGRYLVWRLADTVLPAEGNWYEIGWIWFCFAIELLALTDSLILYIAFLRMTDRSAEADRHEARLRTLPPDQLPSVDIFIPTYNEPFEVLEKTIIGALCLDYANFKLWVLDDGRRPWLKDFCETKGVGYLTRPDNAHAKAGNINHALTKTDADFVAIFDADFIPQRNFLMRTIGFFSDPKIGIVQLPHAFYNHDPMQANLALRKALPDEQRFFFEAVMPSRDGWDAAFCCGSNSVTRRAALRAIGDALPTDSITEDILLSMTLLRKGYVTRYLCERLAFGLAPESLNAFFVQRQRWARGAIQILYLAAGPFGRGLTLMQRLLFLPTYWILHGLTLMLMLIGPLVFLWTGMLPFVNVTTDDIIYYFAPMTLAAIGGIWVYVPRQYFPFASQVIGTFQSFKILPHVLRTMVKPFGHLFKVTPKGRDAANTTGERGIFWIAVTLIALTAAGLIVNSVPEWQIVIQGSLIPIVAFWALVNMLVLLLVCMISLQAPVHRAEERFQFEEPIWIFSAAGTLGTGRTQDVSLSGAGITVDAEGAPKAKAGERVRLYITEVGFVAGTVVRLRDGFLGVQFDLPPSAERDLLIRKLFTGGLEAATVKATAWSTTRALLKSIWASRMALPAPVPAPAAEVAILPPVQLPAQSLVIAPRPGRARLAELSAERRNLAA
jgi:cellulose synthase/poly-beta-1,6-N-acetylglucosamine synthase-like glycosyltransferase